MNSNVTKNYSYFKLFKNKSKIVESLKWLISQQVNNLKSSITLNIGIDI